jgi:outer membrane receptor protein involved in Fe transport
MATKSVSSFAFGVSALALMAGSAVAQTAPAVSEVIVTANKRSEKLKDVASSVTAISGAEINTLGIQEFRDYEKITPGLSLRDEGSPGSATLILRGLNTGSQQTSNTAAFYIDDTQITQSGGLGVGTLGFADPDLGDVDHIEVLKGPQGTLYGANSLGGLVRVIEKKPDFNGFSGNARIEGTSIDGGGTGGSAHLSVNVPLVADKLSMRVSGFYRDAPGWTNNLTTGTKDVNESKLDGGRFALRATPTEKLTIDFNAMVEDIKSYGLGWQDNKPATTQPLYGRYNYKQFADLGNSLKTRVVSLGATYDLGFGNWVTTGSYTTTKQILNSDYTPTYGGLLQLYTALHILPPAAYPAGTDVAGTLSPDIRKETVESRFVSKRLGALEFTAGGYYTKELSHYSTLLDEINGATLAPLSGPFAVIVRGTSATTYEEYAGFLNATYYLTDTVDLTGGVRLSHNKETSTPGLLNGQPGISFFAPAPGTPYSGTDDPATYLAALRWRPTKEISTYLRAASGYRPGFPQNTIGKPVGTPAYVRPDTVWNYEAGVKGTLMRGLVSFDAAVYHIDWKDVQLNSLSGGTVVAANGAKAKVDGFEGEAAIHPTANLDLLATAGFTNARLGSVDPGVQSFLGAKAGDKLPLTPEKTLAVIADQRLKLFGDHPADIGLTVKYQSNMPSGFPSDTLNTNVKLPSFTTADLRGSISFGRWTYQARIDNLFNKFAYNSLSVDHIYAGQTNPSTGIPIRPRTFTLSLSTSF